MRLRTELEPVLSNLNIESTSKIVTIGSCFSDHIGQLLLDNKLSCTKNPLGTIYNPISIFSTILASIYSKQPHPELFTEKESIWHHFDFHSSYWSPSKSELTSKIEQATLELKRAVSDAHVLVITFGTAFVYRHKQTQAYVSNCHKVPSSTFEKILLTQQEIIHSFSSVYQELIQINPALHILLTISPVRHIKDTLSYNSVSKSILRVACHQVQETYPNVSYFPVLELMQDDLRDYRFYEKDLIHPNQQAIEYIYERFATAYFSENLQKLQEEWQKIKSALQHKPFYPGTVSHLHFLENLAKKLATLNDKLAVSEEIKYIEKQLREIREKLD